MARSAYRKLAKKEYGVMDYEVMTVAGETVGVSEAAVVTTALEVVMRDLSEECYAAGWLEGLEDELWRKCQDPRQNGFGQCGAEEISDQLAALRALSEHAGCWLVYDDEKGDPVPISLDEWRRHLGER